MPKLKIRCEAISKQSGVRCRAKGYFTPTTRRMLCRFHRGCKSWDSKTRKYKGLYKNTNIDIQKKIIILRNLKNFKNKTDEEIRNYIQEQEKQSNSYRYRTKYYTRHYLRWRNTAYRNKRHLKDQLDDFLQILGSKSKV